MEYLYFYAGKEEEFWRRKKNGSDSGYSINDFLNFTEMRKQMSFAHGKLFLSVKDVFDSKKVP